MKKIMIMIAILAALTLTGCAEKSEFNNNGVITGADDGGTSASFTGSSEVEEPTNSTSEVENDTSTESKSEEKPVESTSSKVEQPVASTSIVESKPVSSTTSSKVEVPVSSSTSKVEKPASSTSTTTSKPVSSSTTSKPSAPVSSSTTTSVSTSKPVHNCSTDGHIWEVTTTTTEPKWCREMHIVYDTGFDSTLSTRYLGLSNPYKIYVDNMEIVGVDATSGSASIDVEVWGTETYETKVCTICGHIVNASDKGTINPIGEWQYINGVNPRITNPKLNFNTLFYDPYNVPQVVIDNINLKWELMWG